jgi:hypothetical protein
MGATFTARPGLGLDARTLARGDDGTPLIEAPYLA